MKTVKLTLYRMPNILILLFILLAACAPASSGMLTEQRASAPMAPEDSFAMGEVVSMEVADNLFALESNTPNPERIVLKDADLTIVVESPPDILERIVRMAEEMGGYVVSANLYQTRLDNGLEVPRGSITIRVPEERLNDALNQIESTSDREPFSKNLSSQDVTREYTDLQSRLRNLEEAETQLREIMSSAHKTEDVLAVYNQLVQVREQIEIIKGQIQYYEQSAALSAIVVELLADEAVQPLTIGAWQPIGVAKDAIQALINALKFIANGLIWIALFILPVVTLLALVFLVPLILIVKTMRNRRRTRQEDGNQESGS
jgi:hypothetical protein